MVCIMPRLHLGPENESPQNEVDRSIFTFKLYSLQRQHNKKPKHSEFFKIVCFETSLPYRYLTNQHRFATTYKALSIACIGPLVGFKPTPLRR